MHQHSHPLVGGVRALGYAKVMGKGVHQGAVEMPVAGMHAHAGRLVDYQEIVVLIDYVERYVLGQDFEAVPLIRHHETDDVIRTDYGIGLCKLVIHTHIAILYGICVCNTKHFS